MYAALSVARKARLGALIILAAVIGETPLCGQFAPQQGANPGKELFTRAWEAHDKNTPAGDGLGPMRNAESCVACHFQGGVGGGGDFAHNVDLLSVTPPRIDTSSRQRQFKARLLALHVGFQGPEEIGSNIVLHRFGLDKGYEFWRDEKFGNRDSMKSPVQEVRVGKGLNFLRSQRNTPALFGAGLLDEITRSILEENAEQQAKQFPEVSGEIPRDADGQVGRFGWRGQIGSLREFVLTACANELGLQSANHPQPKNPLAPDYRLDGVDLNEQQCNELVMFVAALPRPQQIRPTTTAQSQLIDYGERLFHTVGCTACHTPRLGGIEAVYTDMLLHDMGANLADPVIPNVREVRMVGAQGFGGYSGGFRPVFASVPATSMQEWRTPPLWGVADSAPYLHDGRAATLPEAITLHGGEAKFSVEQFAALPEQERKILIAFLESLRAPVSSP